MRKLKVKSFWQLWAGFGILLFLGRSAPALNPDKPINQYLVDHWDISAGLPSNLIHSITQTPDGYLWIATNKGLVRFDGIKFSTVKFAGKEEAAAGQSAVPEALYLDKNKKLWIGSSIGLTSYDYQTRRFHTFTPGHGLAKGKIRRLTEDKDGNLWLGFDTSYVNRFSNGKFTAYDSSHGLEGKTVNAVIEDRKGNLLVGTRDNGVFTYKDNKFFNYPLPGLKGFLVNMLEDHNGCLWISTSKGLLKKTGPGIETYTTAQGLSADHISDLLEDSGNRLWIGTINGLDRLKKEADGKLWFEPALNSVIIICLFEDYQGSLWAGTYDSGLYRLKDAKFQSYYPLKEIPGDMLFSICEARDGDTWIGTVSGKLYRVRRQKCIEAVEIPGLTGTGISAIAEDNEANLWLGTNGNGVFQKKDNEFTNYTTREGLADNLVTGIYKDSRGYLWIDTFAGVSICNPAELPGGLFSRKPSPCTPCKSFLLSKVFGGVGTFFQKGPDPPEAKVHTVYEDSTKDIWIATDNGIAVLKGGKIPDRDRIPSRDSRDITYYLEGITVTWIYEDPAPGEREGRVFWLSTHGAGLKRLMLDGPKITNYTTDQGMTTNFVYRFFADTRGNFWIMSDSGILRVSKASLNRLARGETERIDCVSFGLSEGLVSLEFNNPYPLHTAFRVQNGDIWFLAGKGISMVNPDTVFIDKFAPPVVIEEVLMNQASVSLPLSDATRAFEGITELRFEFTAPTLMAAEKAAFQYRLEGFDQKWIYLAPGQERTAHYKNPGPGAYTFRVIACNAEGIWNNTGASIAFTLKSSFLKLKSPLFYLILLVFFLALAVVGFIISRLYKKRTIREAAYKRTNEKDSRDIELPSGFVKENIKKLTKLMEVEKVYRNEKLSLPSLAEMLSIRRHQLSLILNEHLKTNFNDYINSYRLEEAKRILESSDAEEETITGIAIAVGFHSQTGFYKSFKEYTGMTPNRYRKEARLSQRL